MHLIHSCSLGPSGPEFVPNSAKDPYIMSDDILRKIQGIIADQLDVKEDDVKPEKSFTDDLGADSLAIVELVLALEEEFGVKIPDEKVDEIKTVGDAVAFVKANKKKD